MRRTAGVAPTQAALHWFAPGRSNPGLQFSPLRAAFRREAFCGPVLSYLEPPETDPYPKRPET